ncbi:TetR/AcrR family transcriptional regulator [Nicoliella lavandulae]|uniref:TetR/AcrR family transcriptional regulator n=1 Tax=Nicoliella lavandulae TaxID=3082954 RepID=A0ABU8SIT0_9LACO
MTRSKTKIVNAFLFLINQKSIFQITSGEIIKQAGIAKGTYYHNFHTKMDILRYYESNLTHAIVDSFITRYRKLGKPELTSDVFIDIFADAVIPIIYENRDQVRVLISSDVDEIWSHYLEAHYVRVLKKLFPEDKDFNLLLFIKYVHLIVSYWISSLIPMDQRDFKKKLKNSLNSQVIEMLKK